MVRGSEEQRRKLRKISWRRKIFCGWTGGRWTKGRKEGTPKALLEVLADLKSDRNDATYDMIYHQFVL